MEIIEIIIRYAILFIIIMSGSIFLSYKFKRKSEQTIPISILAILVIMYIFGLIGYLKMGVIITSGVYLLLGLYAIICSVIKKEFTKLRKNVITKGSIIFFLLYILFAVTTFQKMFTTWDEYTYWSLASKNMYILNDFVTNASSTVNIIYPPSPTILQYFFAKIIGMYSQGIESFTIMILGFSLLLPMFKNIDSKRKVGVIATLIAIICIPAIFSDSLFYLTIYADPILGILIGYAIYEYFTSEKNIFLFLGITLVSIVMALTKPTGIFIALTVLLVFTIEYIINLIRNWKKDKIRNIIISILKSNEFKIVLISTIFTILAYCVWTIYAKDAISQKVITTEYINENPIKYIINSAITSFTGGSGVNNEGNESNMEYYEDLFNKKYYSTMPFDMSAGTWIVIFAIRSISYI